MRRSAFPVLAAAVLAVAAAAPLAFAQDRGDAGADARSAAAAARADVGGARNVASLDALLADAQRRHPGRVVEVSYDDDEYEIEIRQRDLGTVELTYSARTGELLEVDRD